MSIDFDLIGIGAGPFNLSVAALLEKENLEMVFLDRKPEFSWHAGLMLDEAFLQTCWMKDLVTPIDPTNRHSFLNYLVAHNRFYAFINAEQPAIRRAEFADYLNWVANRLTCLNFGTSVEAVELEDGAFQVSTDQGSYRTKNLCVGTGVRPFVPTFARHWLGDRCLHAVNLAHTDLNLTGKRVTIVGGGQTGAEVLLNVMQKRWGIASSVNWLSRRPNYEPLDETPFTNEYFGPDYVSGFRHLDEASRIERVDYQKLASDGISPITLKAIYQMLYAQRQEGGGIDVRLLPERTLRDGEARRSNFSLKLYNGLHACTEHLEADIVIFATGFEAAVPDCLEPIAHRLDWDMQGYPRLDADYKYVWDGPEDLKIFGVNAGKFSHGIADAQTSLMAWRSAQIINALLEREVYNIGDRHGFIQWEPLANAQMKVAERVLESMAP